MNTTATAGRILKLGNGLEVTIAENGDASAEPNTGVLLLHGGAG